MTWFPTCSSRRSRSQAPLCHCTRRPVSNRAEGTMARLRYFLGGDRPSQTPRQAMSQSRFHEHWLGARQHKGGISRLANPKPEPRDQRLPPILRKTIRNSLPSYSKGSWGLSVLPRVEGIFTPRTISLSPWSRQRGCRYAIRAGRNLPDKEFRYLRTVIVTAAVYRGFGSKLRLR